MKTMLAAVCGSLLAASTAGAQQRTAPAPLATPKVVLTDAQKLEKSAESLQRMKSSLRAVLTRVEEARNEKDVVKLNCVNEKLTQVKGLLKVAEQADIQLHEALVTKDPTAEAEFAKITIARSKIDGLKGDADQCIGQLAYIVDEKTTVEVQQPTNLADDSRRDNDDDDWRHHGSHPPCVRPPPASRFQ
jgi:hypothetical protein